MKISEINCNRTFGGVVGITRAGDIIEEVVETNAAADALVKVMADGITGGIPKAITRENAMGIIALIQPFTKNQIGLSGDTQYLVGRPNNRVILKDIGPKGKEAMIIDWYC